MSSSISRTHPKIQVESISDLPFLIKEFQDFTFKTIPQTLNEEERMAAQLELTKWIESLFDMASDSIEINGIAFKEATKVPKEEYEPVDEGLRQKADTLSTKIQEMYVTLGKTRKTIPKELYLLNQEKLKEETSFKVERSLIPDEIEPLADAVTAKSITIDNYESICQSQSELYKELPATLEKAHQIEVLLNDLNIPALNEAGENVNNLSSTSANNTIASSSNSGKSTKDNSKRRRSSLGRALLERNSMEESPSSPRKVTESLLKRLEAEQRRMAF